MLKKFRYNTPKPGAKRTRLSVEPDKSVGINSETDTNDEDDIRILYPKMEHTNNSANDSFSENFENVDSPHAVIVEENNVAQVQ